MAELSKSDLEEHRGLKAPMEALYEPGSSLLAKALSNWNRKNQFLARELEKYRTYVEALENWEAEASPHLINHVKVLGSVAENSSEEPSTIWGGATSSVTNTKTSGSYIDTSNPYLKPELRRRHSSVDRRPLSYDAAIEDPQGIAAASSGSIFKLDPINDTSPEANIDSTTK